MAVRGACALNWWIAQHGYSIAWPLVLSDGCGDFQVSGLGIGREQGNFSLVCYPTFHTFCLLLITNQGPGKGAKLSLDHFLLCGSLEVLEASLIFTVSV